MPRLPPEISSLRPFSEPAGVISSASVNAARDGWRMFDGVRILTRPELTAALAARQMLLERRSMRPSQAIRLLTPLQGQDPPAPYVALAARLDGFTRAALEAAFTSRSVVKTTLMRSTLHITTASDFPVYAQLARQPWLRRWRRRYAHLDEVAVVAELRAWLAEPRSNEEIRMRVRKFPGVDQEDPWDAVFFARTLLPLVQIPPAGHWGNRARPRFIVDPRPLSEPAAAGAFGVAPLSGCVRTRQPS